MTFLLAATFAFLQVAEAAEIHRCAHHDGPAAATEARPLDSVTAHFHDADAAHPRAAGSHDAEADHGCTCMGDCHAPTGVAMPGVGALVAFSSTPPPVEQTSYAAPRPVGADHVLPFAHGPPTNA